MMKNAHAGRPALRPSLPLLSIAAALMLWPVTTQAQIRNGTTDADQAVSSADGRPVARAVPVDNEIQLDGRLTEPAWQQAPPATGFIQGEPVEGEPAGQRTVVRVLYDHEAIYVGARLYDTEPERIARQLVRRDERGSFDAFEVSFDPNNDGRTGYNFQLSAAGVRSDSYLYEDTREDESWDPVWDSGVHIDSEGWSVEMRIPLSQLRYEPADTTQSWGINFMRRRVASNERSYFALVSRREHGRVSRFGTLRGLDIQGSSQRIELRPYLLAQGRTGPAAEENPFFDGDEGTARVGGDLRYGLGPNFTLDLTVNPDFGQVEIDPAVINLSAFETFFPEKRPFFVEDARIFDFSLSGRQNTLFFSRRIGREPTAPEPDDAEFVDVPTNTTIVGAAKLTGRTSGGLSLGVLTAMTDDEQGKAFFPDAGEFRTFAAEPSTWYGVIRAQQDFRDGATWIGAIGTGLFRDLPEGETFDFLTSQAYSAGVDFEHNWGGAGNRDWAVFGFLATSFVNGSTEALTRIQESSAHFFQRPDADDFDVDSTATFMTGAEWRLQFERRSGRHWTGAVWLGERTPGFEINDLGFVRGNERLDAGARISYQEIEPGPLFRDYRINMFTFHNWRHEALDDPFDPDAWGRAHKAGHVSLRANATFLNWWGLSIDGGFSPETLDDTETRGGPLIVDPRSWSVGFRGNTDRRAAVSFEPNFEYRTGDGSEQLSFGTEVSVRPSPRFELELEPSFSRQTDHAQYVTTTDDLGYAPTFGERYIFGDLERRTLSLDTRLNVTFTPTLTLQLFAQPFISSGDYVDYKALARAESFDFDVFRQGAAVERADGVACAGGDICRIGDTQFVDFDGDGNADFDFSDRDFNLVSLRGNAVLRWEYRPGSTIFLVWQQNRSEFRDFGDFDVGRDADDLFALEADNIFILKANFWVGL